MLYTMTKTSFFNNIDDIVWVDIFKQLSHRRSDKVFTMDIGKTHTLNEQVFAVFSIQLCCRNLTINLVTQKCHMIV